MDWKKFEDVIPLWMGNLSLVVLKDEKPIWGIVKYITLVIQIDYMTCG